MSRKRIYDIDEFYVGYLPEAPLRTSAFIGTTLISAGVVILLIVVLVVINQRKFSDSVFEYEQQVTLDGYVFQSPLPHLKIQAADQSYQTVLLVGFGKAGADKALKKFEKVTGPLDGQLISLTGYLIKGEGKMLMQIDDAVFPVVHGKMYPHEPLEFFSKIQVEVTGEVVDPKCYFGVMKPGEGKAHRSCAIRCISGGIPPVFHSGKNYFLLLDKDLQPVNQYVLPIVGDFIELEGELVRFEDWKLLLVDRERLGFLSESAQRMNDFLALNKRIAICSGSKAK